MTLSAIVTLLQLALSLLGNPNLTPDQRDQANLFASQAVSAASLAVQTQSETEEGSFLAPAPDPVTAQDIQAEQVSTATFSAATLPTEPQSVTSAPVSGSCQLSVYNPTYGKGILKGSVTVSKSGGSQDGVSLYAAVPNDLGYSSPDTKWFNVMAAVLEIPQQENFSSDRFYNISNSVVTTTNQTVWFKASYPDGTICYDIEQTLVAPVVAFKGF